MTLQKTLLTITLATSLTATFAYADTPSSKVITADEINWGYLNPLRGDKSPGAADLWGDRTKNMATGMLVKFKKGFQSPPHIHNITYRGIVIEGKMHNDDPTAATMWMPTGSFWTQPAGENHITAANGEDNLIYLEIDSGPYLVQPSEQHFDSGEHPINLHESNLVWLNDEDAKLLNGQEAQVTNLWGSHEAGKLGGAMIKLPAGYQGKINVDAETFRAVVIQGTVSYQSTDVDTEKSLEAGSYFTSQGKFEHGISTSKQGATIYIRTNGRYEL